MQRFFALALVTRCEPTALLSILLCVGNRQRIANV